MIDTSQTISASIPSTSTHVEGTLWQQIDPSYEKEASMEDVAKKYLPMEYIEQLTSIARAHNQLEPC